MPLPLVPDPESEALKLVLRWFDLISAGNWNEALALIDAPSSYGQTWSRAQIEARLAAYGTTGSRITPPATASGTRHVSSGRFDDCRGFYLDCDLPLNGSWSDLSAQFEFRAANGQFSVSLQDILVK